MNLFGVPACAVCGDQAAAHVMDRFGEAWLCRNHSRVFLVVSISQGRTVPAFVEAA